jgi:hypothetical protein
MMALSILVSKSVENLISFELTIRELAMSGYLWVMKFEPVQPVAQLFLESRGMMDSSCVIWTWMPDAC